MPFHLENGKKALKQVGANQCAVNLLTLKTVDREAANWRSVVYFADFYWRTTTALTSGAAFPAEHFPHTIHVCLNDVEELGQAWAWGVF